MHTQVGLSVFTDGFAQFNRMYGSLTGFYATLSNLNIRVRERDDFIMPIGFGSRGTSRTKNMCIHAFSNTTLACCSYDVRLGLLNVNACMRVQGLLPVTVLLLCTRIFP
jgi:hypothetical protein